MAPVKVECPIKGCDYVATHAEVALVLALLSIHPTVHVAMPRAPGANAKTEKLKRPSRSGRGLVVLKTRWGAQLLECCKDELSNSLVGSDEKGTRSPSGKHYGSSVGSV